MTQQVKIYIGQAQTCVGTLFFNASGGRESSGLEYSSDWIDAKDGFAIDPALPLRHGRSFRAKKEGRSVFHGAIADSEPDGWGRQVIMRTFDRLRRETKNKNPLPLTSLDLLLAVDDFSRVGALRFQDESGQFQRASGKERAPPLMELATLFSASRAVETDTATLRDLEYLRGRGTSLGGLRPKCTVIDNTGSLSIGKFPSVGDLYSVTKGEVLALELARKAGITAADAQIVLSDSIPVALIKRFDRGPHGTRIPYVSAATLLGIDDTYESHTYTEIVDALKRYGADYQSDVIELWRRIAFSILINNVDDHMRNHGFLHVEKDLWRLSPAFDINPFPNKQRILKTWISEESGDRASIQELMKVTPYFGMTNRDACVLLRKIEESVSSWRLVGKNIGMTTQELDAFESAFEHEERLYVRQLLNDN